MSDPAGNSSSNSEKLNHILAEYIRRRDTGQAVDLESICVANPDIAVELRSFAAGEGLVEAMIGADDSVARNLSEVESASMDSSETLRPGAVQGTAFQPNSQFGRYQIIRLLGEGAMGSIYLAQDTNLEREVALKIPKLAGLNKEEFLQRFTREAKAAARLDHPNVCRVYDADQVNDTPYITIEYINGQPLSRFIGTTEMKDQRRVAEIIKQIAEGLAHAHAAGILHRDLKPGNVLMRDNKIPCVSDFGLARRVDSGDESQLTHEGTILGTPAYMAPEQIEGKPDKIGPAADIYSLGVMLYYLLTEELPFKGSIMSILGQAMRDQPQAPTKLRGDIAPKLEDLCLSMMEKSPAKRPASMNDVATILADWLETASPQQQAVKQKQKKNRDVLAKRKAKIEDLIERGQYAGAISDLEKLAAVKHSEATAYVKWAREKIPELKSLPAKMKKNAPLIVATAQEFMQKHDYAQAAQLIQNIPPSLRNREAQKLLAQAIEWEDEADLLLDFLKECVETRQFKGIEENLNRFLELKPGSRYGRELKEKLNTYSKLPFDKRKFRFDDAGNLQPRTSDSLKDNWLVLGTVCFVLVFGVLTWGITIYLKNDDQTIAVEIDDEWLEAQGGSLSLVVDGDEHTISGPGLNVTVSLGEHGFSVKNGDVVVHNPETFTIEKQGRQVLRIDSRGMTFGKSEETNPKEDRLPSSTSTPQSIVETDSSESHEWTDLFNGRDFTGWVNAVDGKPIRRAWKVENGTIHRSGPLVGDIRTVKKYGNFELEFEWKLSEGGNSGVIYRVENNLDKAWKHSLEYQLLDDQNFKGQLSETISAGAIYGLFGSLQKTLNPGGQWNRSRIIANGTHIEHWLNGSKIASTDIGSSGWNNALKAYDRLADYPDFGTSPEGYIILQDHKSDVWFRNIRIKELNGPASTSLPINAGKIPFPTDVSFTDARPIGQLNKKGSIDGYPWISPDGLYLWWTREGDNVDSAIMQASRAAPGASFGSIRSVLQLARLASLSPNGLEIVCLADGDGDGKLDELCTAKRSSVSQPFSRPQTIDRLRSIENPKGTAFSEDGLALLILSSKDNGTIYRSERIGLGHLWGVPQEVKVTGRPPEMEFMSWPSLTGGGKYLLFSYPEPGNRSSEYGGVANMAGSRYEYSYPRSLLLDGKPFVTRGGRYCEATGELFYCHPTDTPPHREIELRVAKVEK